MPNSDNAYGTFNKMTQTLSQVDDGSTALLTFANVEEAKNFFFTSDALAVFDECCTELQWTLVDAPLPRLADAKALKYTMAFGTKGSPTQAAADDWAEQYKTRLTALIESNNWMNNWWDASNSEDHLF